MVAKGISTLVNFRTKEKPVAMVKLSMIMEKSGKGRGTTIYHTGSVSNFHLIT